MMTERARKIRDTKRKLVLRQLETRRRDEYGCLFISDSETKVLLKWIAELLEKSVQKPVRAEIKEASNGYWWYACGECHGAIVWKDKHCRHCGSLIDWSRFEKEEA